MRRDDDYAAACADGQRSPRAGSQCYVFDNIHDPEANRPDLRRDFVSAAGSAGFTVIEVDQVLSNAPERDRFVSLDAIHMTEPYHRLMAKEWLKFLVGARSAAVK